MTGSPTRVKCKIYFENSEY